MEEDIGAVNQKLARANQNIRGIRVEAVLTNEYLDLMTDTLKAKFEVLTNVIRGDSLERLEKTREEAKRQEALANLLSGVSENIQTGVDQRNQMIDNQEESGTSLAALGLVGATIATALGALVGVIKGYTDSVRALTATIRTIGGGLGRALGAIRQSFSLGALALRIRFESINKIFGSFERVGGRIIGIFSRFAARAKAILSVTGALGRASLMAPINLFYAAVRRIRSVFSVAATSVSKFGSTFARAFSSAINMFRSAVSLIVTPIRAAVSSTGVIGKLLGRVVGFFRNMLGSVGRVAGIVSRVFAPLNFIYVGFKTITGIIEGFKQGGLLGALEGGLKGFFNALVGVPLDFLKGAVAWILDLFGLDRIAEFLRSFNFTDIISSIISAPFKALDYVREWIGKKISDLVGSLTSFLPDWLKGAVGIGDEGDTESPEKLRERRSQLESEIEQMPQNMRGRGAQIASRQEEIDDIDRRLAKQDVGESVDADASASKDVSPSRFTDTTNNLKMPDITRPESLGESMQSTEELALAQRERYALDSLGTGGRGGGTGGGVAVADNSTTNMISQPTINNNPLPNPSRRPDTARDLYYRNPYRDFDSR